MSHIDRASRAGRPAPVEHVSLASPLHRSGGETLHRQVERRLRDAIADGRLRPGARLASTRTLAAELGIARITAQTAYDQLVAEGYLEVDGRSGTRVARDLPERGFNRSDQPGARHPTQRFPERNPWAPDAPVTAPGRAQAAVVELGPEWFGLEGFDARGWERLMVRAWREVIAEPESAIASYAGPPGDDRLRAVLADHLAVRRGVRCRPDDIVVTAGLTAGVAAIARTWLGPGRVCIVEDPGGEQLRRVLGGAGATIVPVPVDDHGLRVADLPLRADAVFVTPSWQYPAGGSLSLPRRLALLRWAEDAGAIVVEDDCESELRYAGEPLPSLQGLAQDGRVLYLGTFSKVLFPGLRTGYMVTPAIHRGLLLAALEAGGRGPGVVEQRALALLLEGGGFHRHLRGLRARYVDRRDAFTAGLAATGAGLDVRRASAGGHLIVGITDPRWTATQLAAAVATIGVRVESLSANRLLAAPDDELVVYVSRLDAAALAVAAGQIGRVALAGPGAYPTAASLRRTAGRIPPAR